VPPRQGSKVEIPTPQDDQPRLVQVGIIAAVCFALGILWPALSGVSLVPSAPNKEKEQKSPTEKVKPKPERPEQAPNPLAEVPVGHNVPQGPQKSDEARAEVDKSLVVNCHDENDRRLSQCDNPGFDTIARDRLLALSQCEAANEPDGVLSIGFELDFKQEKITRIISGKSTTVDNSAADALIECAKREFRTATLRGVEHTHSRYLIFYMVQLHPPGAVVGEAAEDPMVSATGTATIIWNSARIRSQPEDGEVRARLLYGTKVVVSGKQGDWYRVRYDAKGSEGWVHRNALAM